MAVLLRGILVVLAAIAVALAIPRIAGEEYRLSVRWERSITSDEITRVPAGPVTAEGILVTGSETIAILSGETGDLLSGSIRQPVFSASDSFLINQSENAGERWAVTDRRTGSSFFFDRHGIPRLYGPVLAQFQRTAVTLQHARFPGIVTIPHRGEITVLDVAPLHEPDRPDYVAAVGNVYGTITLVTMDFSSGRTNSVVLQEATSAIDEGIALVYGVHLTTPPEPGLIVLRGRDPQRLEYFRLDDLENPVRHVIPPPNEIIQPPTIRALGAGRYAIGVRDSILLLSSPEGTLDRIGYTGDARIAGALAGSATAFVLVTGAEDRVQVHMHESAVTDRAEVLWTFPGVRISALGSDLLVVERDSHYVALEVQR